MEHKIYKAIAIVSEIMEDTRILSCQDIQDKIKKIKLIIMFKKYNLIDNFKKCVKGYHLINRCAINEKIWENINVSIFSYSGIYISYNSEGSHLSGRDIICSIGSFSNKSAKYNSNKTYFDISSYRLTTICSENNMGTEEKIIEEINKRKNFDFYSFIIRYETKESILYDWIIIPSNHDIFNPSKYTWKKTLGKRGKNKDTQIGCNTNTIKGCKMSISFQMSSQLWIHIKTEEIKKFIMSSTIVNTTPKYNYIELYNKSCVN